jgi:hypothetical protein
MFAVMSMDPRLGDSEEWVCLGTAPDQLLAEMWRDWLTSMAIPARLAPADVISFLGVSGTPCRVLVPARYRDAAEQAIAEL